MLENPSLGIARVEIMVQDLSRATDIDFSGVRLDYEAFRQLARNPNLDIHQRIGYPTEYRQGREEEIFRDILGKLPVLGTGSGKTLIDIGPGCANLPRMMIHLCRERGHRVILVDCPEMLAQLPDVDGVTQKVSGAFPAAGDAIASLAPAGVDAALAYGVLSVVYLDSNPFTFVDAFCGLLKPGGQGLIGDIPNMSKRRRFFASEAGRMFHRQFTGRDADPVADFNSPASGIDDAVLAGLVQRAQLAGVDAYVVPQHPDLPMANRRDDLLLHRP